MVGQVGDAVALHALVSGTHLADGVIVHRDESVTTVAVPAGATDRVVDAISAGGVISVLVP